MRCDEILRQRLEATFPGLRSTPYEIVAAGLDVADNCIAWAAGDVTGVCPSATGDSTALAGVATLCASVEAGGVSTGKLRLWSA